MAELRNRFIPLEKQSKKAQRKHFAKQRGSWNGVNPASKVILSGKVYNRKKRREEYAEE